MRELIPLVQIVTPRRMKLITSLNSQIFDSNHKVLLRWAANLQAHTSER